METTHQTPEVRLNLRQRAQRLGEFVVALPDIGLWYARSASSQVADFVRTRMPDQPLRRLVVAFSGQELSQFQSPAPVAPEVLPVPTPPPHVR